MSSRLEFSTEQQRQLFLAHDSSGHAPSAYSTNSQSPGPPFASASSVSSPARSSSTTSAYTFATISPGGSGSGGLPLTSSASSAFTPTLADLGAMSEDDAKQKERALIERRIKQRDLKRKSRARKKNDIESMKDEVRILEAKYEQLYVAKMASTTTSSRSAMQTGDHEHAATGGEDGGDNNNTTPLIDKYTHAREEMNLLRTQIAQMKEKVGEYDRFSTAMEGYLTDFDTPLNASADPILREQPNPFEPLSEATCFAIIQQCYQQIFHPQWRGQRISTGASIFGWRDERFVDGTTLQFSLTKPFQYLSKEYMMQKTWDIVTTVEHMHTIQRSTIGVKVLQVINDDIMVTQRCVHHPQLQKVTCVNMLMFRLRTERGYVVAYTTINHPPPTSPSKENDSNQATFIDIDEFMKENADPHRDDGSGAGGTGKKPKVSWVDTLQWFIFEDAPVINPLQGGVASGGVMMDDDDDDLVGFAATFLDPPTPHSSYNSTFNSGDSGFFGGGSNNNNGGDSVVNVTFGGRMDNKDLHYVSYFLIEVVSMIVRWDQAVAYSRLTWSIDDTDTSEGDASSPSPSASSWDSSEVYSGGFAQ